MIETKSSPKANESVWLWLLKILSGLLIVFFLGTHFFINHLTGTAEGGQLTFEEILKMYTQPGYLVLEGLFLTTVISHGLIGLRGVILDLNLSRGVMRILDFLFIVVGITAVGYGIWLLLTVASLY
jgi:succinate dehydrogenase hydrophobic anchor subunit